MSKSELAAALAKYNSAMGWSTIAVAVGIFGEYISHFIFTKEKKSRAEWLCKSELAAALAKYNSAMGWSTIAVAVGIFGEYISHFIFTKEKKSRAEWLC